MKKNLFLLLLLVTGIISSCKKNNYQPLDYGYDYYGLEKGRFIEYEIRYMEHDSLLNKHDTSIFYLKTVIGSEYVDNEGRTGFEYLRYRKNSLSGEYVFLNKWVTLIADRKAQLVEENQRKVKLVFPVGKEQEWDANMYNNLGEQLAHYEGINIPYANSFFSTDSAVTVEFYKYKSLIDDRLEQEIYAKGIGMVYKVSKNLYYQFGWTSPYKGTELYYSVIATGTE